LVAKTTIFQQLAQLHSMEEYLAKHGHHPASSGSERLRYICPLHGPESNPSFYVFNEDGYEHFHCFGCRAHGTIADLVSSIENISIREAVERLSDGMTVDTKHLVQVELDNDEFGREWPLEVMSFRLSRTIYEYLKLTGFDKEETEFIESILEKVDLAIRAFDLDSLREIYPLIVDKGLPHRMEKYRQRKEEEERDRLVRSAD
jgi:hypothetical protein